MWEKGTSKILFSFHQVHLFNRPLIHCLKINAILEFIADIVSGRRSHTPGKYHHPQVPIFLHLLKAFPLPLSTTILLAIAFAVIEL